MLQVLFSIMCCVSSGVGSKASSSFNFGAAVGCKRMRCLNGRPNLVFCVTGVFKASSFYEMLERLWAAMFDLLLKMSNMYKDRR